jgi:glycerol dehydrogenase-like iron-containing ADH family enzyme
MSYQPTLSLPLAIAPARVLRGWGALADSAAELASLGQRPLVVGGERALQLVEQTLCTLEGIDPVALASTHPDCSEATLERLYQVVAQHSPDLIIGVGGGKALDTAKLLAHQVQLPIATVPTTAATCAAWSALSNVYSDEGAFLYDVSLYRCPDLLILDYGLVQTAPPRTLVAGIGDAIAKWYEASISSGQSQQSLIIGAVQQARVLRDLLLQNGAAALAQPGGDLWCQVVDATVLMAGVIGGIGGAQCRTVAAHAVHNGLTQLPASHGALHGEKVAYGILVQLRLEELVQGSQLAQTSRQQLLQFYSALGLPQNLEQLGLGQTSSVDLYRAAAFACEPQSDIHHLPFVVDPALLVSAMNSTAQIEIPQPQPRS